MSQIDLLFEGTRLLPVETEALRGPAEGWHRVTAEFEYRNLRAEPQTARALILIPPAALSGDRVPLNYLAGYQLGHGTSGLTFFELFKREWLVVNPITQDPSEVWPGENPVSRGVNLDVGLLHASRALPFVDDSRVLISGLSSGGVMTLYLAAETFPLSGAAPDVTPSDVGYEAAYIRNAQPLASWPDGNPNFGVIRGVFDQMEELLGPNLAGETWWEHSGFAHVDQITCPVSATWSTADMLVPIEQVTPSIAEPYDPSLFPPGYTRDPRRLLGVEHRLTLVELVDPTDLELKRVSVPIGVEIRPGSAIPPPEWTWIELPTGDKQWTVCVMDEGAPEPWVDHLKYASVFTRNDFNDKCLSSSIEVDQLSEKKLHRLMARYAGREQGSHGVPHLDFPEQEKADVLRGLRTYARSAEQNRQRLMDLYADLPKDLRTLDERDLDDVLVT